MDGTKLLGTLLSRIGLSCRLVLLLLVLQAPTSYAAAPSITIEHPRDGAVYLTTEAVTVAASAQDTDGTVTEVSLQVNGSVLGVRNSVPFHFNLGTLAVGDYRLRAFALDNNGEVGVSAELTLFIREPAPVNTPPIVRIVAPTTGATFNAPTPIQVEVDAQDPEESGRVTLVELWSGSALLAQSTNAPFTMTLTNLGTGTYSIVARATDNRFATTESTPVVFHVVGTNPPRYSFLELGNLGGLDVESTGMNNLNQVVGLTVQSEGPRAFWAHSGILEQIAPVENAFSYAYAINDFTNIVGEFVYGGGTSSKPFLWTPNEGVVDLPMLNGGRPSAISQNGTIVGHAPRDGGSAALIWENRTVRDLLAPLMGTATTINDLGQIGGGYQTNAWGTLHPYIWHNGAITTLPRLSEYGAAVRDINNGGVAVGYAQNADYQLQPVRWGTSSPQLLGTFGGRSGIAYAVNDQGVIIGAAADTNGWDRAFVWQDGVMHDLENLVEGAGDLRLRKVSDINNSGAIAGTGVRLVGGQFRAYAILLRPIGTQSNQPPQISITLPASVSVESDEEIVIPVQVSDADGTVTKVEFFADGNLIGVRTNNPFSLAWKPARSGEVCFHAVATDDQSANTASAERCVHLEIVPTSKPEFVFVDLGPLHDGESYGTAINDLGEIAGKARDLGGYLYARGRFHFARFDRTAQIHALNNSGLMGGEANMRGFILTNIADMEPLWFMDRSSVMQVNQAGWATLEVRTSPSEEAYLFDGGEIHLVGSAGIASIRGLNDSGVAVGSLNGAAFGFSKEAGRYPISGTRALDINNQGDIVGAGPVLLKNGNVTPLPTGSEFGGVAAGINESGDIAGTVGADSDRVAALWSGGKFYDLNLRTLNIGDWVLRDALRINERGDVVGTGMRRLGDYSHAFLLKRLPRFGESNAIPQLEWTAPASTRKYFAGENVPLEVAAWDDSDEVLRIDFLLNNTVIGSATNRPFQMIFSNAPAGNLPFIAVATDYFGATNSAAFQLNVSAVDPSAPSVAIIAASTDAALEEVRFNVRNSGHFRNVDAIRLNGGDPLLTADVLQKYDAVLLFSMATFNNTVLTGNLLADFVDAGRGLVITPSSVEGRLATGDYFPFFNSRPSMDYLLSLTKELPHHPILQGVATVQAQYPSRSEISVASGVVHVARWSNGDPLLGIREVGNGRIAGFNMIAPSELHHSWSWKTNTDGGTFLANALLWAARPRSALNVAITAPAYNSTIHPGGTVRIDAVAASTNTSIRRVDFYADALKIGSDSTSPYSIDWLAPSVKTNVLTAIAYGADGSESISVPLPLRVSSRITVVLSQPPSGATYFIPVDINFSAQVNNLDGQVTKVEFFAGPDQMAVATNAPYTGTWRNAGVGTYEMYARVTDNLGSVAESQRSIVHILNTQNPVPTTWTANQGQWHSSGNWSPGIPRILDPASVFNGGTVTITGSAYARDLLVAQNQGSGHVVVDGGSLTVSNEVILSAAAGSTATLRLKSGSRLNAEGIFLGLSGTASVTQESGRLSAGSLVLSDFGAQSRYDLSGGEVSTEFQVIGAASDATFRQTGGTNRARFFQVANRSTGNGVYELVGGLLDGEFQQIGGSSGRGRLEQSGGINLASELNIGYEGTGAYSFTTGRVEAGDVIIGVNSAGTLHIERNAEFLVKRSLVLGDGGFIISNEGGALWLAGTFDNRQFRNSSAASTTNIALVITTNAPVTDLEAASVPSRGFTTNYAWASLELLPNANARLVDRRVNQDSDASEAFLAHVVTLHPGSSLNLNALELHTESATDVHGSLILSSGSAASAVSMNVLVTGNVIGPGVILSSVTNSGTFVLTTTTSRLDVAGGFTQSRRGASIFRLSGTQPGSGFQQLNVVGDLSLDGALRVEFATGFTPIVGDRFRLLESRERHGKFSSVEIVDTFPSVAFQISYSAGGAILEAITPPTFNVEGAPSFNPETGFYEQRVQITNAGTAQIEGVRLYVNPSPATTGLISITTVENNRSFLQFNQTLGAGDVITAILQFNSPTGFTNADLSVEPAHLGESQTREGDLLFVSGERIHNGQSFQLRFGTIAGRSYRVQYSDDMVQWKTSDAPIIGTGGLVQWIDFGPPRTDSSPGTRLTRYYRMLLQP